MRKLVTVLVLFTLGITSSFAKLRVFACEPEWAALVVEIAGIQAKVKSATSPHQDPHHIEARPSLIARMRNADLVVCTGAGLEDAWLPLLFRRSANAKVQPGQPGHFMAADHVTMLDIPKVLDRSQGDIHAQGNPHIHTDPRNILKIAKALMQRLQQIDPKNSAYYQERFNRFNSTWQKLIPDWEKRIAKLRSRPIITQHRAWRYLINWSGLKLVATIEEKPGVAPSPKRLSQVATLAQQAQVKLIVHASYLNPKSANWLGKRNNIKVLSLPFTVGADKHSASLSAWFERIISLLEQN